MIKPEEIPHFTGNLDLLEATYQALAADGSGFRSTGSDIHTRFQGLASFYEAPEAEQLFATTAPVQTTGENLGTDVESVARTLSEYANEVRPLVTRLEQLRQEANAFVADVKRNDLWFDQWQRDQEKIDKNAELVNGVKDVQIAFWDAERRAANKIYSLFSCIRFRTDDGSHKPDMYGYSAEMLEDAELPWGTIDQRTVLPGNFELHVKEFIWDGLIVDNIWGSIEGLVSLKDGETWEALGRVLLGAQDTLKDPHNEHAGDMGDDPYIQESRQHAKEFAKGLVAWDMWDENPARASATVVFNVLTLGAGPLKAGSAAKAGLGAKAARTTATVGEVLDPISATAKAVGAAAPKVAEVTAGLRKSIPALTGADATTVRLPNGDILRTVNGEYVITKPDGSAAGKAPGELSAADRAALDDAARSTNRTPVDVGAVGGGHGSSGLPPRSDHKAPAGLGNIPNGTGRGTQGATEAAHTGDSGGPTSDAGAPSNGRDGDSNHNSPGRHGNVSDHFPINSLDNTPAGGRPTDSVPASSHNEPDAVQHGTSSSGGDQAPRATGPDVPPQSHEGGFGGAESTVPDGPRGNLPDGSWAGENGLALDRAANSAADDFMRRSAEAEPRITESMQTITDRVADGRLIGLEYRLKGEDSLKRKIATDMLEDIGMDPGQVLGDIKDSIRYTMEVPSHSYGRGVQQAINDLQAKGFENVTFKNTWDSPGYKGINSTWRDPITGQVFELQFHTAESFAAKMDGHVLYEKERLPGVTPDELVAIKAEQAELFGKVPVPRDAGAIGISSRSVDDAASVVGKNPDSAADEIRSVSDDVGGLGGESADAADGTRHLGDDTVDETSNPYTQGSNSGWGGAGWVQQPSAYAAGVYDSLRATPNHVDVPAMARSTGVNEAVIRQVKSHMIRQLHDVVIRPGEWKRGLFTPRDDIAALWDGARKGTLNANQITEFRNLMTHEYVESQLMKGGLPYLYDATGLWRWSDEGEFDGRRSPKSLSAAGAHDLAPNPVRGGFGTQWQKLGLRHPKTVLASDLSNIDDFVKDIVQELRAKGVNLK
ncbi:hypothetical protein [Streptomyces sp. NPDC000410]|uniref:hypothetical protein n=1 Tax=Streptomyces sp. NPDC000410 TaxID=3154254 RepID=UPI00332ED4E9